MQKHGKNNFMHTQLSKLENLLKEVESHISNASAADLKQKPATNKWSKQEILGHLVDSAINNLQRFTEVQFQPQPYILRGYNQEELVKANNYQAADVQEILTLFLNLNQRILKILEKQTPESLAYKMIITDGTTVDLAFWIADYVTHAEHHIKQIMN